MKIMHAYKVTIFGMMIPPATLEISAEKARDAADMMLTSRGYMPVEKIGGKIIHHIHAATSKAEWLKAANNYRSCQITVETLDGKDRGRVNNFVAELIQ